MADRLASRLAAEDWLPRKVPRHSEGKILAIIDCQGLAVSPAPSPCQTSMAKMITRAAELPSQGSASADQRQSQERQTLVHRQRHHQRLIAFLARHPAGGEKLGQLPAHVVDGRDQTDQDGRAGHRAHKQRDDRDEGGETHGEAKKSAIQQVGSQVMPQIFGEQVG